MLQEIDKEATCPSFKSSRFPKPQIFVQIFCTNLQSPVQLPENNVKIQNVLCHLGDQAKNHEISIYFLTNAFIAFSIITTIKITLEAQLQLKFACHKRKMSNRPSLYVINESHAIICHILKIRQSTNHDAMTLLSENTCTGTKGPAGMDLGGG